MMAADQFPVLPPVPLILFIGGERLELTPLRLGEIPAFARAIRPLASSLSVSPDWLALLDEHGEAVIDAVAIASRRPKDWLAGLELDDAVRLSEAVFEVNADFFIQRVWPSLTEAAAQIGTRMGGAMPASA